MINFSIWGLGWLDCSIQDGNQHVKFSHSSDYGDKFQELLNLLFNILIDNPEFIAGKSFETNQIVWCDDLRLFTWHLLFKPDRSVDIEIIQSNVENESYKESIIKCNILFEDLLKDLFLSLKKMFDTFGIVGYKSAWEVGNFPFAEYIKLSSHFHGVELNYYNVFNNDEGGLLRLNINEEIKLLLK